VILPYPDPQLCGASFRLRPFREDDFDAALTYSRDEATALWVPPLPADDPQSVVELFQRYREEGQLLHLVIADLTSDMYLGEVMAIICDHQMGELGCGLLPQARGRGIAAEALSAFATWCVPNLDLRRLQVLVASDNRPALALAEHVGFRREGVLRSYWDHDGDRFDAIMLSMLPAEVGCSDRGSGGDSLPGQ
jgi:RimJ/RimL family protein N-acetyltransferase